MRNTSAYFDGKHANLKASVLLSLRKQNNCSFSVNGESSGSYTDAFQNLKCIWPGDSEDIWDL